MNDRWNATFTTREWLEEGIGGHSATVVTCDGIAFFRALHLCHKVSRDFMILNGSSDEIVEGSTGNLL